MAKHEALDALFEHDTVSNEQDLRTFHAVKRGIDVLVCLLLLPMVGLTALVLWAINPFCNPGPVFFVHCRMGKDCDPIHVFKFRTMQPAAKITRGADDPLEVNRIPKIGHILRRTRIDELPQVLNVLRGDMSLIGPRPDYFPHARHYLRTVPGYRARHAIRPGVSGLAQVQLGYVDGVEGTYDKVAADLTYLRRQGYAIEAEIFVKTLAVILRFGGR